MLCILLRTEPGRQLINSLDTVRLIVIDDLDEQADGGTHVSNTREINLCLEALSVVHVMKRAAVCLFIQIIDDNEPHCIQ